MLHALAGGCCSVTPSAAEEVLAGLSVLSCLCLSAKRPDNRQPRTDNNKQPLQRKTTSNQQRARKGAHQAAGAWPRRMRFMTRQRVQTRSTRAMGTKIGAKMATMESVKAITSSMIEITGLAQPKVLTEDATRVPALSVCRPREVGAPTIRPMTAATMGSTPVSTDALASAP